MWSYEKRLQCPVRIAKPNAKLAQAIMSQLGGPDGELGASLRYLCQRYTEQYGPVTVSDLACADVYDWLNAPWPWQPEGEEK